VATKQELELAKRLISARVLGEDVLRAAFGIQQHFQQKGTVASLVKILYAKEWLPRGSLDVLAAPSPLESQPFADYRVEALIGEGGSSVVYRATYLPNGSPVAIKVLDPVQALRPDFLARFQREAQILIELEHENVVLGYEVGEESGRHFFSMEYVEGLTVLDIIDRRGFLENEEALSVTLQAARALEYLHAQGYLHRDIKPGNIMVDETGCAKLIDLGLIHALEDGAGAEEPDESTTVGTVEYLSPEQARGRADLDPRSDIYSLGVTLYHMVVGDVPFHGETDYEVMAKQVLSAMDTQKVKQRRISPEVHFFITKMTSKERENRYENVREVILNIAGYLPDGPVPIEFGDPPAAPPVAPVAARAPAPVARPVAPRPVRPVSPVKKAPVQTAPVKKAPVKKAPAKQPAAPPPKAVAPKPAAPVRKAPPAKADETAEPEKPDKQDKPAKSDKQGKPAKSDKPASGSHPPAPRRTRRKLGRGRRER
jgi:predicted Ser/Thr protein kinase